MQNKTNEILCSVLEGCSWIGLDAQMFCQEEFSNECCDGAYHNSTTKRVMEELNSKTLDVALAGFEQYEISINAL